MMMPDRRSLLLGAATVAGLTGLWRGRGTADESLARPRAAGVLRVGDATEPPFAFTLHDGTVTGGSADVARAVAWRLGVDTRGILSDFGAPIDELERGRRDGIAAGLAVNDGRARRVAFGRPTRRVPPVWLTRPGNRAGVSSCTGPTAAVGVRVAVLAGFVGSPEHLAVRQRRGLPAQDVPEADIGAH